MASLGAAVPLTCALMCCRLFRSHRDGVAFKHLIHLGILIHHTV